MITVPVKLSDDEVHKIDYFVESGRFKNRNQAIKALLQSGILFESIPLDWEMKDQTQQAAGKKVLKEMLDAEDLNFYIEIEESAVDLIGKERDRY